jgi:hypothetical protein
MGLYRDFQSGPPTVGAVPPDGLAPTWLQKPGGQAWLRAHGDLKDWLVGILTQAVKARAPAFAPLDALQLLGHERQIDRGITETVANYRARVVEAWELWQYGGTAWGLLRAMLAAGYPTVYLLSQTGATYSLDGAGQLVVSVVPGSIHLGGSPAELWSDFGMLITTPLPNPWPSALGYTLPVMLPSVTTSTLVIPPDGSSEQRSVSALIKAWKPAHARCVKVVVTDGHVWGVGGLTWGQASLTWGAGNYVTWTPPEG